MSSKKLETPSVALEDLVRPNLYLVLPGKCNARCPFCCFRKQQSRTPGDYLARLDHVLENLPSNFSQITVLGGEPSISPYFGQVLDVLSGYRKGVASKVVLTTNASGLILRDGMLKDDLEDQIEGCVDHVNISRHSSDDATNATIFGVKKIGIVPTRMELKDICTKLNVMGIDVSLNCVIHNLKSSVLVGTSGGSNVWVDEFHTVSGILHYLSFAKSVGASAVCFKKLEGKSLSQTSTEKLFSSYRVLSSSQCPTCRSKTQLISGMRVTWQAALEDKSGKPVQDLIFHQNGKLSTDWEGKNVINIDSPDRTEEETEYDTEDSGAQRCSRGC